MVYRVKLVENSRRKNDDSHHPPGSHDPKHIERQQLPGRSKCPGPQGEKTPPGSSFMGGKDSKKVSSESLAKFNKTLIVLRNCSRKLKNRVAAQTSRDRKKAKVEQMETAIQQLFTKNETIIAECEKLKQAYERLQAENAELQQRLQVCVFQWFLLVLYGSTVFSVSL